MASETIHKQDFVVRNLQTRSVTLFPTRAQIIRDVSGVSLKPGQNQIVIEGLTPTVDEHSIKVEGTGAATITDLSVQLVTNKEIYEEIYPSDDECSDSEDDDDESDFEDQTIKDVDHEIKTLSALLEDETEKLNSASARLTMLDKFSNSVQNHPPHDIKAISNDYHHERIDIYKDHKAASDSSKELEKKIAACQKERVRLGKAGAKAKAKALKEKRKKLEAKERKKSEARKEKARIRTERAKFWPKKVYKVIISLDAPSGATPATSRRNSIDSLVKVDTAGESSATASDKSNMGDINLSLSYITYSASWSPRYDLSLNTITQSGVLDFQAELRNTTCETWKDAKVVLSTSQTSYQGLDDTIPVLQPWHVRLAKNNFGNGAALYSQNEQVQAAKNKSEIPSHVQAPRDILFGVDGDSYAMKKERKRADGGYPQASALGGFGASAPPAPAPQAAFRRSSGALFSSNAQQLVPGGPAWRSRGGNNYDPTIEDSHGADLTSYAYSSHSENEEYDMDNATLASPDPALLFEQSLTSETGLTTTYDLPSTKTLAPGSSTVKHKIARLSFSNIAFSHILIPKLKASAFLKARLRNSSNITILKGTAGLTLDGSFLGQSTIPRCGAGDSFSLPLGVDPSITVVYGKPTVRRSQSGIFNKEDCEVFTRTAVITNTKGNTPVEITVLDQIPVPEDERLKVEILTPRGLRIGGEGVNAGVGTGGVEQAGKPKITVQSDGGKTGKWGTAIAVAKKGGEVNWTVKINSMRGCKLVLEYEATYPGGETVVAVN